MMQIGVFIPGRLNSERLPNKLILPFGESSLWQIACEKLSRLPRKYSKYVLANDQKLLDIAKQFANLKVIIRNPKTVEVDGPLKYIFEDLKQTQDTHLMFLNPCLAFLSVETITSCLEAFEKHQFDYATSVKPLQNWLFNNEGKAIFSVDYKRLSTKEIEPIYQCAHCFHIFNKQQFFKDGMMLKEGHGLLNVPIEETTDVDTEEEYHYAKWKYQKKICN